MKPRLTLVPPSPLCADVYTVQRKIVVAGDFLDGSCWERRLAALEQDKREKQDDEKKQADARRDLETIRMRWQQRCASRASQCSSRASSAV